VGPGRASASFHKGKQVQLIITDAWLATNRVIYLSGTKLLMAGFIAALALMLVAAGRGDGVPPV